MGVPLVLKASKPASPVKSGGLVKKKKLVRPDACGTCFRTFPDRPPPTLLLEWRIDKHGNPQIWEYGLRKTDTSKVKEPCQTLYRRIEDARVTDQGQVVFDDLDYARQPNTKELSIALADLRRDRDPEMAVWARKKAGFGETYKTKKGGASRSSLGGEVPGDPLDPSLARCEHCLAPTPPPGYTLMLIVSENNQFSGDRI